jgi:spore coat protein A
LDVASNNFGAQQIQELGGVAKVMRFEVVSGGGSEDFEVRNRLAEPKVLPAPSTQRTFVLDQGPSDPGHPYAVRNEWQINGRGYDDHRVDVRPRRGTTEIWHFVNKSNFYHPMHMHLGHFKVVSRGGQPVNEPGWKDTVFVAGRETVSVLAYFGGFTGRYVYHCHALEHGDLNMMGQMEVIN